MKFRPSWETWVCLLFTILGVAKVFTSATTHEYGWLLSLGNQVLSSGPPHVITDTAWPAGPWVVQQWLPAAVMAWLVRLGHGEIFTIFVGLCVSVPIWVGSWFLRRARTPAAISIVALSFAGLVLVQKAEFRVEPISWAILALEMVLLSGPVSRAWFIVPLLMIWANVHGSFILGPIVAVPWARSRPVLWLPLIVAAASTLINPYGLHLWLLTWSMLTSMGFSRHLSEWMPFWIYHPEMFIAIALTFGCALRWRWRGRMALLTLLMVMLTFTSARATVVALGIIMPVVISTIRFPDMKAVWQPAIVSFVCIAIACCVPLSSFIRQRHYAKIDERFGVISESLETDIANFPMQTGSRVFCYPVGPCNLLLSKGMLPLMDGRTESYPRSVLRLFFANTSPWIDSQFASCADYLVLGNVILGEPHVSRNWSLKYSNARYRIYGRNSKPTVCRLP